MKAAWALAKREIASFFVSPVIYVVVVVWLLWSGFGFYLLAKHYATNGGFGGSDTPLSMFFGQTIFFYVPLLVLVPVITMKLLAEEKKSGTLEALSTAPVTETSIVLGKYVAAMACWVALWFPTTFYAWITSRYGDVDWGAVGASYLGVMGMGAYYMAIGLLMSAIAPNQIVAAVLTFLALGILFAVGLGQFVFDDIAREVAEYISVWAHMESFARGVVDSRYLVYDASVAALALFLAVRVLAARRLS